MHLVDCVWSPLAEAHQQVDGSGRGWDKWWIQHQAKNGQQFQAEGKSQGWAAVSMTEGRNDNREGPRMKMVLPGSAGDLDEPSGSANPMSRVSPEWALVGGRTESGFPSTNHSRSTSGQSKEFRALGLW